MSAKSKESKMFKKLLSFLMCSIVLLSLFSCNEPYESDASTPTESSSPQEIKNNIVPASKDTSYKDIVCTEAASLQRVYFSFGQDLTIFSIAIPKDWTLSVDENKNYRILLGTTEVGTITPNTGSEQKKKGDKVFSKSGPKENNCSIVHSVYRYITDGNKSFRHHITFEFDDKNGTKRTLSLNVDYSALHDRTVTRLFYSVILETGATDPNMNLVNLNTNATPNILILGNSFVNSSDIGNILRDMADDELNVTAISVGMARVEIFATEPQHANLRSKIESGTYDAVFLCGFYNSQDVSHLTTMKQLCEKGGAELIIFQAHNEKTNLSESVTASTKILDWRGEINHFINEMGVDYYDMCKNDTYDHSKPLAGYVGAHMIYRAVLGKIPPACQSYGAYDLSHTYIVSKLGQQYVDTGTFAKETNISNDNILYF